MRYRNFAEIAERNRALLKKLNFTPGKDDPFTLDNPESMRASGLFPDVAINRMFQQLGATPESTAETASKLDVPPSVGMILVRPDMLQIAPLIEQFIARRYGLVEVSDIQVTPEQYWTMYEHVIVSNERIYSRLTRAAVYLSMAARLMVFHRRETEADGISAIDDFSTFKGRQGVEDSGTLRGGVIYKEAMQLGFHTLEDAERPTSLIHLARTVK